jgi:hypothetical protein
VRASPELEASSSSGAAARLRKKCRAAAHDGVAGAATAGGNGLDGGVFPSTLPVSGAGGGDASAAAADIGLLGIGSIWEWADAVQACLPNRKGETPAGCR